MKRKREPSYISSISALLSESLNNLRFLAMRIRVCFLAMLFLFAISCKNGGGKKLGSSVLTDVASEVEEPTIQVNTVDNIGSWTMPITSQISNRVTLKFNAKTGKYYTLEKMSNANRTDSLGVIVTKKDEGYHIEYTGSMKDNYTIDESGSVMWHCPDYDNVRCSGKLDMNNLSESFLMHKPDAKSRWLVTSSFTTEQAMSIYDWSKQYVKACVFEPGSLVFPDINEVKFFSRNDARFKIEYKAIGKDLYNKTITYPVSIVFETPDNPVLHTISLE